MKQKLKKKIGTKIRKVRESLGLTQVQMVENFNIGRANYSRIEKGEIFPNAEILHTLKTEFNVSLDWLISGEGQMYPPKKKDLKKELGLGKCGREMDELIYLIANIPMVKHAVLGHFLEYKMKNVDLIKKLLKESGKAGKTQIPDTPKTADSSK